MPKHNYFVYILTNINKNVLYVGVTNSLLRRISEHYNGLIKGFTQQYKCKYLVYYEHFDDINLAISREKQIKKWGKVKKSALIEKKNPEWKFLNDSVQSIEYVYEK